MHAVACMGMRCRNCCTPAGSAPHLSFNDSWHSSRGAVTAATAWCTRFTNAGRSPASSTAPWACRRMQANQGCMQTTRHCYYPHSAASQESTMPTCCTCCAQMGSCLCQLLGKCMTLFATTARGSKQGVANGLRRPTDRNRASLSVFQLHEGRTCSPIRLQVQEISAGRQPACDAVILLLTLIMWRLLMA